MNVQEVIAQAEDAVTVRRVVGEPYEKDGVTVIPVATVRGGGGAGGGANGGGEGGEGGGFGVVARPVGAYVIRDGEVTWQPALDLNRVILGGQVIGIVAILTVRSLIRLRARRARARG